MPHDHHHDHPHDHDRSHAHAHTPTDFGRAFAIGITLNIAFVAIEAFYGWRSGSLALLADAGHNLSDVGGLVLAWAAMAAARMRSDDRHTYGWRRGSILASFANAVILLLAMGSLAWEAAARLCNPALIDAHTVMWVAGIGVVINGITAWLFMHGGKQDLNIRGAFLHMAADALISAGVVLAGALYLWQGWAWIDPVLSLIIAAVIVVGTWSLFRQSLHLMFDGVPEHIDLTEVRKHLRALPDVIAVHDLHVWAMATSETSLTAHLVIADVGHSAAQLDELLHRASDELREHFNIRHATLQIESEHYASACSTTHQACAS